MKKIKIDGKVYLLDTTTGKIYAITADGKQGEEVTGLDASKAEDVEDDNPAQAVIKRLNEENKKLREQFESMRDSLGGLKPEDITALVKDAKTKAEEAEAARKEALIKEGKFNEVIEAERAKYTSRIGELEKAIAEGQSKYKNVVINNALLGLVSRADVVNANQVASLMRGSFALNDKEEVIVVDANGGEVLGTNLKPMSPKEYVENFFTENPHFLKAPRSGGAGSGSSGGSGGGKPRFKSEFKSEADKAAFIGEHGRNAWLELPDKAPA